MLKSSVEVVEVPAATLENSSRAQQSGDFWSLTVLTVVAVLVTFGWQAVSYLCSLLPVPVATAAMAVLVVVILRVHAGLWRSGPEGEAYRATMRVRRLGKRSLWMILLAVPPTAVAAFCFGILWIHLTGLPGDESEIIKRAQSRPYGLLPLMIAMAVVGPLIEELMVRGRIQGALERRLGRLRGILIASVVFSFAHFAAFKLPNMLLIGIVFGAAVSLTGSIWAGVVLHVANNGLAGALALTIDFPRWSGFFVPVTGLLLSLLALVAIGVHLKHSQSRVVGSLSQIPTEPLVSGDGQ
jgi:membrane protease YdiL (CAAX protease family)